MLIDIDRHILMEIIDSRNQRRALRIKLEQIEFQIKAEMRRIREEMRELEAREGALLAHIAGEVKEVDTHKGQETVLGKEMKERMEDCEQKEVK